MKQFLYLDTDIISSIIAQSEQGVVTQMSIENAKGDEQTTENKKAANATIGGKGKLFKLLETEEKLEEKSKRRVQRLFSRPQRKSSRKYFTMPPLILPMSILLQMLFPMGTWTTARKETILN